MIGIEQVRGEGVCFLPHTDPVVLELNRFENRLKEKERELVKVQCEIRALRATEILKDKAVEHLESEVKRLEEKLRTNESHLKQRNLEIKKIASEKREALSAQYAAEATLRRVYANQKEDDHIPIEMIIAPLEAELKMLKSEVGALQEDKRALERHTKSKEAALLEAEKILTSALERALIVEEVQNQNFELRRQIEICLEENKVLEKTNRQKVVEVEKLSETISDLEGAILAGGAAANTIRDYQRQISILNDEKRTLERELARVKVSANRIASVVANEWKDEKDKVMPVKQWLEERRVLQAEMQKLKDKLSISERTAKAEAQIKDKLKLRLRTIEEGLKNVSSISNKTNGSPDKATGYCGILSSNNEKMKKRSASQPRASRVAKSSIMIRGEDRNSSVAKDADSVNTLAKKCPSGESLLKNRLWASLNKVVDDISEKENAETNKNGMHDQKKDVIREMVNDECTCGSYEGMKKLETRDFESDDMVSGFLYDRLQKEVVSLRKACDSKDSTLNAKEEEIKALMRKIATLVKAMEVESRKMKRESGVREKENVDDKIKNTNSSKRSMNSP